MPLTQIPATATAEEAAAVDNSLIAPVLIHHYGSATSTIYTVPDGKIFVGEVHSLYSSTAYLQIDGNQMYFYQNTTYQNYHNSKRRVIWPAGTVISNPSGSYTWSIEGVEWDLQQYERVANNAIDYRS